jgi:hypothetical protein
MVSKLKWNVQIKIRAYERVPREILKMESSGEERGEDCLY